MTKLKELISDLPSVYLTISEEIVEMIHKESDLTLSENIYITLTDHISMSLEREQRGVILENPLLMEIRRFYKKEFSLAHEAAAIIGKHLDLKVSEDEIGFITLHIVNASMNQRFENTMKATRIIQDILSIVKEFYKLPFDDNSMGYDRFVRHLQFFARRVLGEDEPQSAMEMVLKNGIARTPFTGIKRSSVPMAGICLRNIFCG